MIQDLLYALRMIRKRPGLAAIAIAALALGIGANSAVFSVVNALLLHPLQFPQLDRLVEVRNVDPRRPLQPAPLTPADFLDLRERSRSFEHMAAYSLHDFDLTGVGGEPEGLRGIQVTQDFLKTLRVKPALGRDFYADEDQAGHDQVAILSDMLWRNRFAADPATVGRTVLLDSKAFLVVGVLPRDFEFPFPGMALFTPMKLYGDIRSNRSNPRVLTAARLRDGVSLEQARAELDAQTRRLAREYPETNEYRAGGVVLLRERQGETSKPMLVLLQATALFVLLIACVNVANLQIAQGVSRQREIALRAALGAGRWRLIRLLLAECVLLALAAGTAGVAVAYGGVSLIKRSVSPDTGRLVMGWNEVAVHPPVLLFTLAIAIVAGVVFGLSSAMQASRVDLAKALKDGNPQGGSRSRLRPLLVMGELMLAVVAVTGAGQAVRGFQSMFDLYQGFSPEHVLATRVVLPDDRYSTPSQIAAFYDRALAEMSTLPDVEAATVSSNLPGALRFNLIAEVRAEGRTVISRADATIGEVQRVGPDYFRALQIPLHAGRGITAQDGENAPLVVVVSDRLSARCWPGESAIGKRLQLEGFPTKPWRTVVGVVSDVHQFWFQKETRPMVYLPYGQSPLLGMYVAVRTHGDPMAALAGVRDRFHRIDAGLPLHDAKPMSELTQETMSGMQLITGMMMVFGFLGLVLAAVGVYGVMAYTVSLRNREFGIRLALGAKPGAVLRMVVWQGFVLTAWGIGAGVAAGFGVSRLMEGVLFGASARSVAVLGGVPVLLALVSVAACWIPARGVTAVDPVRALRQD